MVAAGADQRQPDAKLSGVSLARAVLTHAGPHGLLRSRSECAVCRPCAGFHFGRVKRDG
jgi:hypothetical protein